MPKMNDVNGGLAVQEHENLNTENLLDKDKGIKTRRI